MSTSTNNKEGDPILFWGCFIALITTAFAFITRAFLVNDTSFWPSDFGFDTVKGQELFGAGIWPFAISIILFSLIIDKVGYKFAMMFAFISQMIWAVMGVTAISIAGSNPDLASGLIFWGGLILALGNGTVEAFINPVVATMFDKDKTKWLNILHAGWPGGLVIAGIITILMGGLPWTIKLGIIAVPALVYFFMLVKCSFPVQERVAAGISYRDMLSEFGILGAAVVGFLISLQLMDFFPSGSPMLFILIGVAMVVAFGVYTKSLGRPLLFVCILIMMPLATTEIGTDGWISGIMENAVSFHGGWILVYTSVIMMVLRFFAGPIVHKLSPLGLLIVSAILAIVGLLALAGAKGVAIIFAAATLYALGKTFFWPTMLGIVSEQTPRGGALTLNAISGIGMLAVGTLGFPYIGALQADKAIEAVAASEQAAKVPGLVADRSVVADALQEKKIYEIINYNTLNDEAVADLVASAPAAEQDAINASIASAKEGSAQKALGNMAIFPALMLIAYILLLLYFKARGGYRAQDL